MRELLEQYRNIKTEQDTLNSLSIKYHAIHDETTTIEQAALIVNECLTSVAHEIVTALHQQFDDSTKQLDEPESAAGGYKPLWAVVPEDADDDCWRRNRGAFKQLRYYMFTNKQDAEYHKTDGFKVVPVWGE